MTVRIPPDYPASAVYVAGGCGEEHKLEPNADGSMLTFACEGCEESLSRQGHGPASWWLDKPVVPVAVRKEDLK